MAIKLLIIFGTLGSCLLVYLNYKSKEKYNDPNYVNQLQRLIDFLNWIEQLNDYVTWVERDRINAEFAEVGKYFKNKSNYYKEETRVAQFNTIYQEFDSFIATYNN